MITGHAYPWDVLGDAAFPERVAEFGVPTVALAAAYHSVRAATPLHPRHQVIHARYAALYRPVRDPVWTGRRLRPRSPDWLAEPDPFAVAADALRRGGLRISAWLVLTHNSRLGTAHPELAVTNCCGDLYPYALCPAQPDVREYAAILAGEAVAGVPVDAVSLEACGQLGLSHNSHHEKTDGAWTPEAARLLSVCCCSACRSAWSRRGLDPAEVIDVLRAAVLAERDGGSGELSEAIAAEVLAARHQAADLLRQAVLERLAEQAPGVPVTLHGHPDPWVTGAAPGLTPSAAGSVTAVLVPAWPTTEASAADVATVARTGAAVEAYVTVLPPADPAELPGHVRRLAAVGASGVGLYHLGLAPRGRHAVLRDLVELCAEQ